MTFWLQMALVFLAGLLVSRLWTAFFNVGYSGLMLKTTQLHCLKTMKETIELTQTALEVKYSALEDSGNSRRLEFEKRLDEQTTNGLKSTMITNLLNATPKGLTSIVEYKNWAEAMEFLKESK